MRSRAITVALAAGVLVAGVVGASAAGLGGLSSARLGMDDQTVASCDSDGISLGYTTSFDAVDQRYEVTAANFTGVNAACDGQNASITLRNGATVLNTTTASAITVAGSAFSITLSTPVAAESVTSASVLIAS